MVLQRTFNRFWAELRARVNECNWQAILTIADAGAVRRNLLTEHSFPTQANVDIGVAERTAIVADPTCTEANAQLVIHSQIGVAERTAIVANPTRTEANAQLVIRSQMMHNCIKASLTLAYLKTIINILPSFTQDGPKFIYYIITNTHVKSILSTRDLLQDLGNLDLKKFGYNIKKLHAEVDHLVAQLKANKAEPDDLTLMMHLIAAYRTNSTNTQFLQHVANLESDWSRAV